MYIPEAFQVQDRDLIRDFLQAHPFGTLTVNGPEGVPVATHLPFLIDKKNGEWMVEGHLAVANPQEQLLQNGIPAVIMIVGAAGYVSSSVYTHINVPTFNYQAVHLTGIIERLTPGELMQQLRLIVDRFEENRSHPIDFDAWPKGMLTAYLQEITGFRIRVSKVEAAFKLSQNRNDMDFDRIVQDLDKGSSSQQWLAEAMRKTRKS